MHCIVWYVSGMYMYMHIRVSCRILYAVHVVKSCLHTVHALAAQEWRVVLLNAHSHTCHSTRCMRWPQVRSLTSRIPIEKRSYCYSSLPADRLAIRLKYLVHKFDDRPGADGAACTPCTICSICTMCLYVLVPICTA